MNNSSCPKNVEIKVCGFSYMVSCPNDNFDRVSYLAKIIENRIQKIVENSYAGKGNSVIMVLLLTLLHMEDEFEDLRSLYARENDSLKNIIDDKNEVLGTVEKALSSSVEKLSEML